MMVETKVVLVGVGGASCSGKTTLVRHLCKIIPNSAIVHQDDFYPDASQIPIHPIHNVQDWDSPEGAVLWPKFNAFLNEIKKDGQIPLDHKSFVHLNEHKDFDVDKDVFERWRGHFQQIDAQARQHGIELKWVLIEGFLLYWDKESSSHLDVSIFLRARHDELKQRRDGRSYSYFADQSSAELEMWRDPPLYWENIAWPAYVAAHQNMFENGDVESGKPTGDHMLVLANEAEIDFVKLVDQSCQKIADYPLWETANTRIMYAQMQD